jgi:hypothetical protein
MGSTGDGADTGLLTTSAGAGSCAGGADAFEVVDGVVGGPETRLVDLSEGEISARC